MSGTKQKLSQYTRYRETCYHPDLRGWRFQCTFLALESVESVKLNPYRAACNVNGSTEIPIGLIHLLNYSSHRHIIDTGTERDPQ